MSKTRTWKIWLRPNLMTGEAANGHIATVSTAGSTWHNEDIARRIVKGRSELRYDTLLAVLNEKDAVVRDLLLAGSSVQDANIRISPRVTGAWTDATPLFDPREHKITVDAVPTAELRKALEEEVCVEVLGSKADGGARIGKVTDAATGKTDGTITVKADLVISGKKIKIAPEGEAGLGVFFVAEDGTEYRDATPLVLNNPKKIIALVPDLPNGEYTLKIVTRYAGTNLLKAPRTVIYGFPLKAGLNTNPARDNDIVPPGITTLPRPG